MITIASVLLCAAVTGAVLSTVGLVVHVRTRPHPAPPVALSGLQVWVQRVAGRRVRVVPRDPVLVGVLDPIDEATR